jgi:hypothetical protein
MDPAFPALAADVHGHQREVLVVLDTFVAVLDDRLRHRSDWWD